MKKNYSFFFTSLCKVILILYLLQGGLYSSSLYAQSNPNSATAGKEFYITYIKNFTGNSTLQLKIVVEKACYITAKYNNQASSYWNGWNNTWVTPGIYTNIVSNNDASNMTTGITSKTITLTSTEDICVYAINYLVATSDATCILPVSAWGTEYRLATGTTTYQSVYAVVAKENNTSVTLHDGSIITLNENEVYHFYGISSVDMTGEKVTSTRPVALFSGSVAGYIHPCLH